MAGAILRSRRVLAGLVAAGALAAALIGSTSAQAVGNDHSSCVLQGVTGSLTPPIPPPPAGNGQTGTYTFNGSATCAVVDADGEGATGPAATTITSTGKYSNIACGTGFVGGSDTTFTGPAGNPEFPVTTTPAGALDYEINFAGGSGPLLAAQGQTLAGNPFGPMTGSFKDGDGETLTATGNIHITPIPSTGCSTSPATGFNVNGTIHTEG
jgi:hypothetical protein